MYEGERTSKNLDFVDAVSAKNVDLTIARIRRESPVLRELEDDGDIKIVGGMYDIAIGAVEFYK